MQPLSPQKVKNKKKVTNKYMAFFFYFRGRGMGTERQSHLLPRATIMLCGGISQFFASTRGLPQGFAVLRGLSGLSAVLIIFNYSRIVVV